MHFKTIGLITAAGASLLAATLIAQDRGPGGPGENPALSLTLKSEFAVPAADLKTTAVVAAAEAFLDTLTPEQRDLALFDLGDNAQRTNWSNFPPPIVSRDGMMTGDMTTEQHDALFALLAEILSEDGYQNVLWQLAAEDTLSSGSRGLQFGSEYYYVSFIGEPALDEPWMLQFGGHHLAINATVYGPHITFSPTLTGGQPLHITYEGEDVLITQAELTAADDLLTSLSDEQRALAVRSNSKINLVLGPGEDDVTLAPEGIRATDLTPDQRQLLLTLISKRVGLMNSDDATAKMAQIDAELDDTWFGWWGPQDAIGAAYYRITGPSLVIEYSPEDNGLENDHAHNMYRDPSNDYGRAWLEVSE